MMPTRYYKGQLPDGRLFARCSQREAECVCAVTREAQIGAVAWQAIALSSTQVSGAVPVTQISLREYENIRAAEK